MTFSRSGKGCKLTPSPLAQRFARAAVERVIGEHAFDVLLGDASTTKRSRTEELTRVSCSNCQFEFHVKPELVDQICVCPCCETGVQEGGVKL